MDLLLLAAYPPELAGFRGTLGDGLEARVGHLAIRARAVGVGLCDAAVGAACALAEATPRAVVLVGTCGAYRSSGIALGAVAVAASLFLTCPSVAEGRAAVPGAVVTSLSTDGGLCSALAARGARAASVATTLAITTDDALAQLVCSTTGCEVEHLEAFAVARVCAARGVRFAAALGVANLVGSMARQQWRAHQAAAGAAASRLVVDWLLAGAPGLAE